mmetsp:Transcript_16202/g.24466  ORF Transcript_16202/g.24466 Transcript_16202/m.24466 type:complete len:82 (-) Transcript_16202:225-470(-)
MESPSKSNVMMSHDANDDPFADLTPADNHGFKQLVSPLDYGTGAASPVKETKKTIATPSPSSPSKPKEESDTDNDDNTKSD